MEAFLSQCVESILRTTSLGALEIVIVNDGSKDKTFKFDSYFGLEQAICCKIYTDELQENSEQIYDKMQEKCKEYVVRMVSPVYFDKNPLEKEGFYSLYAAIV